MAVARTTSEVVADLATSLRGWIRRQSLAGAVSFTLETEPSPASRPRVFRNGGVAYGKAYTRFRKAAKDALRHVKAPPSGEPCFVVLEVVRPKAKTSKRHWPIGDVDNYTKAALDAYQDAEKLFHDDDQVVGLAVFKRYAEPGEEPGIHTSHFTL